MDGSLSIVSINCQGLGDLRKRRDVFNYLRSKKHSIYFLQDTHFVEQQENFISAEWGYKCYFNSFSSNSRGVAILFNNNFEFQVLDTYKGENGNVIIIKIKLKGKSLLLVNVYGPNKDDPTFYEQLKEQIIKMNCSDIVMAGDFNLVLDPARDYDNYKRVNNPNAQEKMQDIINELELCDIWRQMNPDLKRFTWRRSNPFQQSRLDFFLITDTVVSMVEDSDIVCGYRTDHSMVSLKLKLFDQPKRNTFWKFNSSLLYYQSYLNEINTLIDNLIIEYAALPYARENIHNIPLEELQFTISDQLVLDFILMKIRSVTIAYATMQKKNRNKEENNLMKEIEKLEKNENKNKDEIVRLENKKAQLTEIRNNRMEGVLLRSKAKWIAEGEKISKYFCNMEKRHYVSKNMSKLTTENGEEVTDSKHIMNEVKEFYKKLYKKRQVENCEISDLVDDIPKLNSQEAEKLEGEITFEEAGKALKAMKHFKSPGTDGFTVEFFKMFWGKLGILVVRSLNAGFRKGELSCVQKEGIITCIPKGDKARDLIKNWRPISLLNVIYKIGSTVIANRIKLVLPTLINEDQTGFISKRFIGDNIRLIYDLIAYLEKNKKPGLLLNVDFEKAFDSLDWNFMQKVFKAFGFGKDICKWITTFYNNIKSSVIVNGCVSDWFQVQRGCRQGDPISPYLFILCVEILGIMTRENRNIKGIVVNNVEHKLSQYADDTEFLLQGDRDSFEQCINVLDTFGKKSGLCLNCGKTCAVWLGSKKNSQLQYMQHLGMSWNPAKFKVLGIWLTNNLEGVEQLNYEEKFSEIKYLMDTWMKREITPLGRIALLKSLILSKIIHLWILLPNPPQEYMTKLQKMCFKFVWKGKQDRINRNTAYNHVKNGGLGIPNVDLFSKALKLAWIRKYFQTTHKWRNIVAHETSFIDAIGANGPGQYKLNNLKNKFWVQVFEAYEMYYYKSKPQNREEILCEPVCFSNRLKIGNKFICNRLLLDNNITLIGDFVDDDGTILTYTKFKEKYNVSIDYLTYAGISSVLKKYIKSTGILISYNEKFNVRRCFVQNNIALTKKGSQAYYLVLLGESTTPKSCQKWNTKFNAVINWKKCFECLHKITEIKMKWFQVRIIHRILATNVVLKYIGIRQDENCSFCNNEKDTIEHALWECPVSQLFWQLFTNLINDKCQNAVQFKLSKELVLFGIDKNIVIDHTFHMILMLAKQYIYTCRMEESQPLLCVFRRKLLYRHKIECYNAKLNHSTQNLNNKWIHYKNILPE